MASHDVSIHRTLKLGNHILLLFLGLLDLDFYFLRNDLDGFTLFFNFLDDFHLHLFYLFLLFCRFLSFWLVLHLHLLFYLFGMVQFDENLLAGIVLGLRFFE